MSSLTGFNNSEIIDVITPAAAALKRPRAEESAGETAGPPHKKRRHTGSSSATTSSSSSSSSSSSDNFLPSSSPNTWLGRAVYPRHQLVAEQLQSFDSEQMASSKKSLLIKSIWPIIWDYAVDDRPERILVAAKKAEAEGDFSLIDDSMKHAALSRSIVTVFLGIYWEVAQKSFQDDPNSWLEKTCNNPQYRQLENRNYRLHRFDNFPKSTVITFIMNFLRPPKEVAATHIDSIRVAVSIAERNGNFTAPAVADGETPGKSEDPASVSDYILREAGSKQFQNDPYLWLEERLKNPRYQPLQGRDYHEQCNQYSTDLLGMAFLENYLRTAKRV